MKFNASKDLDKYSQDQVGYFSLKDDGDSCRVRILYESLDDVEGYCVHRVKDKYGNQRYVNCIRNYEDAMDVCPCCSSPNIDDRKTVTKFWIPLYKVDEGEAVLWDRGKAMYKQLATLMVEKGGAPFCGHVFTIERHGKAGSMDTNYELIDEGVDETVLDDILEEIDSIPTPEGTLLLDLDYDKMKNFVETRSFNPTSANKENSEEDDMEIPIRRRERPSSDDIPRRRGTTRPDV